MLDELKMQVLEANLRLHAMGLAPLTWGNVSGVDREKECFVIKPSGVPYEKLTADKLVVVSLKDCSKIEGDLNPSSDTKTHFLLYNKFEELGAIVHTHSPYASSFAQAGRDIPVYGTTHADFSYTPVPCTRKLTEQEVNTDYELNTGKVIAEHLESLSYSPESTPAVLVTGHGPFIFGKTPMKAVENAQILEIVAQMALATEALAGKDSKSIDSYLSEKHYQRKHGKNASYGQEKRLH